MKRVVCLSCVVLLLTWAFIATPAGAQDPDEAGPNHEHLQRMSVHVGDWIAVDESGPGAPLIIKRHVEWALDGNYLTAVTSIGREGLKTPLVHRHMVGWDSREERVRSWIFSSNGNFARGIWGGDEMMSEGRIGGLTPDGDTLSAIVQYEVVDRSTIIYRATERMEGGVAQADLEWEFNRVVSAP